ncbi:scaffolding protein [Mycobacterium phage LilSpotty]|uniref:Scaffolding protein n=1 Tax=Mycobacterium phage LilSpotty TaxID=2588512 RepID=A0A4Y6ENW2_9CAUD|nr:scaffolding protein [Mycobacterium phage LilSpotty]QDF19737.1 scaffolding protein [Mycobacterium phage LilSpotty]
MFESEEEVTQAIEAGTATAADVWAFAVSNKLNEGGKKALDAERDARKNADAQVKDLQKQLDEANSKLKAIATDGLPEWQKQINDLKEKLDGEVSAREKAEAEARDISLMQLRIDRANAKNFPAAMAKKLTGTTDEEIDAEIDELLPHLGPLGPRPNPQQGNPSLGRGGTLDAGKALYEAGKSK